MINIPCTIDLEATHEHFHAHVVLDGHEPSPGDTVLVCDAPTRIPLGERRVVRSRAAVERAGALHRVWVRLSGWVRCYELYDVGFEG